jgi:UDP-N-acetylglucosamine 2-epimerase
VSNVLDVDYDQQEIAQAIQHHRRNGHCLRDGLYGDGQAGKRIAQLLAQAPLRTEKRLTY